jgi:imidazolonepropionase-like amidohydrolase
MRAQSRALISTPQVLHSARLRDMATPSSCQLASSGVDVVLAMVLATGMMSRAALYVLQTELVSAAGRVLSRDDDPKFQQFSDEELKVIVEEAARMNRIVAAHVHGKAGIMAAIKAGCKTLEHGTYLDEEAVELMLEKDVMLVATRLIVIEGVKLKD